MHSRTWFQPPVVIWFITDLPEAVYARVLFCVVCGEVSNLIQLYIYSLFLTFLVCGEAVVSIWRYFWYPFYNFINKTSTSPHSTPIPFSIFPTLFKICNELYSPLRVVHLQADVNKLKAENITQKQRNETLADDAIMM